MLDYAKQLRTKQTPWEAKLWKRLRASRFLSLKFKRQVQVVGFIVDFYCHEHRLVIEIYGNPHKNPTQKLKDQSRIKYLKNRGYQVLTFWNGEIDQDIDQVLETIKKASGL